jgi:hypothetical protein
MTEKQFLANCKRISGDTSAEPWDEGHMAGFFQFFRPNGDGVEATLKGLPLEKEILPRLLRVYQATANSWPKDASKGVPAYFVVSDPPRIDVAKAQSYGEAYLRSLTALAKERKSDYLLDALTPTPEVRVETKDPPKRKPDEITDLESVIYEGLCDLVFDLDQARSTVSIPHAFEEGLYYMACTYELQYYVVWPIYRKTCGIEDPFAPWFDLWRHGIEERYADRSMTLYVR